MSARDEDGRPGARADLALGLLDAAVGVSAIGGASYALSGARDWPFRSFLQPLMGAVGVASLVLALRRRGTEAAAERLA